MGGGAGAEGGEERPKRSLDRDDDGGLGFEGWGGGEANPPKPKSCEFEETDVVRDWGLCADSVGEVRLSKRSPPAEPAGEVTLGAAGVDFVFEKLVRLAKGDGFSAARGGGGDVVEGKVSPLKASVNPPMLFEATGAAGEAMSPKEVLR